MMIIWLALVCSVGLRTTHRTHCNTIVFQMTRLQVHTKRTIDIMPHSVYIVASPHFYIVDGNRVRNSGVKKDWKNEEPETVSLPRNGLDFPRQLLLNIGDSGLPRSGTIFNHLHRQRCMMQDSVPQIIDSAGLWMKINSTSDHTYTAGSKARKYTT